MIPKWIAVGEYHISTTVESSAGRESTGWYWWKPSSRVACRHTASSSFPSTTISASIRGIETVWFGDWAATSAGTRRTATGRIFMVAKIAMRTANGEPRKQVRGEE